MMFLVTDKDRWGHSMNIVRADSREQAIQLVAPDSKHIDVEPLPTEGPPGIIWCHDESPDTPGD